MGGVPHGLRWETKYPLMWVDADLMQMLGMIYTSA